jgi:hypothetical protein
MPTTALVCAKDLGHAFLSSYTNTHFVSTPQLCIHQIKINFLLVALSQGLYSQLLPLAYFQFQKTQ